MVYISVAAVTAAIGSALTAGHVRRAGMPAQAKVTKALCPFHSVPRRGPLEGGKKIKYQSEAANRPACS